MLPERAAARSGSTLISDERRGCVPMSNERFAKILEPCSIGRVKTRNRMIKSAAGLWYWGKGDSPVTEKVKCLYEAFAKGGVGLIIMESPGIEKGGGASASTTKSTVSSSPVSQRSYTATAARYSCSSPTWRTGTS